MSKPTWPLRINLNQADRERWIAAGRLYSDTEHRTPKYHVTLLRWLLARILKGEL